MPQATTYQHQMEIHPLIVVPSDEYSDFNALMGILPPQSHNEVLAAIFAKLMKDGLLIYLPAGRRVEQWRDAVLEHGRGQLVLDITLNPFTDHALIGGLTFTYERIKVPGEPAIYSVSVSFDT